MSSLPKIPDLPINHVKDNTTAVVDWKEEVGIDATFKSRIKPEEALEYSVFIRAADDSVETLNKIRDKLIVNFQAELEYARERLTRLSPDSSFIGEVRLLAEALEADILRLQEQPQYVEELLTRTREHITSELNKLYSEVKTKINNILRFVDREDGADFEERLFILNYAAYRNTFFALVSRDFDTMYHTPGYATIPEFGRPRSIIVRGGLRVSGSDHVETQSQRLVPSSLPYASTDILTHEGIHCLVTDPGRTQKIKIDGEEFILETRGFRSWIYDSEHKLDQNNSKQFIEGKLFVDTLDNQELAPLPQTQMDEGIVIMLEKVAKYDGDWDKAKAEINKEIQFISGYKSTYKEYLKALLKLVVICAETGRISEEIIVRTFAKRYVDSDPQGMLEFVRQISGSATVKDYLDTLINAGLWWLSQL